jgi:hypothetical protein
MFLSQQARPTEAQPTQTTLTELKGAIENYKDAISHFQKQLQESIAQSAKKRNAAKENIDYDAPSLALDKVRAVVQQMRTQSPSLTNDLDPLESACNEIHDRVLNPFKQGGIVKREAVLELQRNLNVSADSNGSYDSMTHNSVEQFLNQQSDRLDRQLQTLNAAVARIPTQPPLPSPSPDPFPASPSLRRSNSWDGWQWILVAIPPLLFGVGVLWWNHRQKPNPKARQEPGEPPSSTQVYQNYVATIQAQQALVEATESRGTTRTAASEQKLQELEQENQRLRQQLEELTQPHQLTSVPTVLQKDTLIQPYSPIEVPPPQPLVVGLITPATSQEGADICCEEQRTGNYLICRGFPLPDGTLADCLMPKQDFRLNAQNLELMRAYFDISPVQSIEKIRIKTICPAEVSPVNDGTRWKLLKRGQLEFQE